MNRFVPDDSIHTEGRREPAREEIAKERKGESAKRARTGCFTFANPSSCRPSRLFISHLAPFFLGLAWACSLEAAVYRSPLAVAVATDGKTLYVSDKTAECVTVLDVAAKKPLRDIGVPGEPNGLALSADGKRVYVAQRKAHAVAVIDTDRAAVTARLAVGPWPVAVTLAPKANRLYTCNQGDHSVSVVDLGTGKEIKRLAAVREPSCAALSPDGSRLVVTNLLPDGASTDPALAVDVNVYDTQALTEKQRIKLPPGSTVACGVAVSPDGKWAYVIHTLGRFRLPITQLERGWVHTYALSILDLGAGTRRATVLLDDITGGSADPWGIVCSADGQRLWVTHSGTHEVSQVAIGKVHELLEGRVPPEVAQLKEATRDNIWVRISQDRQQIEQLANDLTALYMAGAIRRVSTNGSGPRGLALAPDGQRLFVANYFSGTVAVLETAAARVDATIPLGPQPPADAARRGEIYFHDALRCFQHWHSCATCHPNGRVDALPWDFMRDGIGNGKDVISMVDMQFTSPHNRRATRATPKECIRTGVTGSHILVPTPAEVDDLLAYVETLRPEPNPLAPGMAAAAKRGRTLFEGKAGCAGCHPAPHYTDKRMHNVGILTPTEPDGRYDTPSLVECYRTAPYFHDGRARSLQEALTRHDPGGPHGKASHLTPRELDDLVAFLLSL